MGRATFTPIREKEAFCTLKPSELFLENPWGLVKSASDMCGFLHPGEKWMGPVPPAVESRL